MKTLFLTYHVFTLSVIVMIVDSFRTWLFQFIHSFCCECSGLVHEICSRASACRDGHFSYVCCVFYLCIDVTYVREV